MESESSSENQAVSLAVQEFLEWVSARPRAYGEAMDCWRSTCPRHSTWEDALAEGLICVENGTSVDRSSVTLTARGRALLNGKLRSGSV